LEVVVVDNGSTDDSVSKAREEIPANCHLRVIRLETNEPLTKAINFGVRASSGKIIGLVHNDVAISKTWLAECLSVLLRDQRIGAVQGKIYCFDGSHLDSCGCTVDSHGCEHDRGQGERDFGQYDAESSIFSASGVAAMFRKDALVEAGMFDEHYGSGLDDLDLCWRLRLLGYFIEYVPKAFAHHDRSATWKSSQQLQLAVKYEFARTRLYVPFKNFQTVGFLRSFPIILLHIFGGFVLNMKSPRGSVVYVRAMTWFLRNLNMLNRERSLVQQRIRKISDKELFGTADRNCNLVKHTISSMFLTDSELATNRLSSSPSTAKMGNTRLEVVEGTPMKDNKRSS
jgi:GT2 family glycosyltransferase